MQRRTKGARQRSTGAGRFAAMPASAARRTTSPNTSTPGHQISPSSRSLSASADALRAARIPARSARLARSRSCTRRRRSSTLRIDAAARPRSAAFQPGIWARPAAVMPRRDGPPRLVDLARDAEQRGQLDAQPLIAVVREPVHGECAVRRPLRSSPPATRIGMPRLAASQKSTCPPSVSDAWRRTENQIDTRRSCAPRPRARVRCRRCRH